MAKFCGKCGSNLEDGAKFCLNCGAMVGEKKTNIVESEQRETQGIEKKKGKRGIIVAVAIVLLVLLVGIIVWILGRNNEPKNNSKVIETQETENTEAIVVDTEDMENEEEKETVIKTEEVYWKTTLKRRYEYDTYGNPVYIEHSADYFGESLSFIYQSEYTSEGELLKYCYYDNMGNLCGEVEYNEEENPIFAWFGELTYTWKYDEDGNLIEETHVGSFYDDFSSYDDYIYYEYDGEGNLETKHIITYYEEILVEEEYSYYAKNGMLTEKRTYYAEHEIHRIYNKQGDIISSKLYDVDGNLSREYKYEYIYDEYGNMTECHEISYNSNGEIEDESWDYYEYVYDEHGNILEQYEYDDAGTLGDNYRYTYY